MVFVAEVEGRREVAGSVEAGEEPGGADVAWGKAGSSGTPEANWGRAVL